MSNIIEVFNLTKKFSTSTNYRALFRWQWQETLTAVNAVNLHVKEGELFGLLGPNGAGKTTLVKMLCTLVLPTAGRATVAGHDVVSEADAVRQHIGLINAEERSFFWRLSGRENLKFFAALHNLYNAQADRRIDELLDLVGLTDHADNRFMGYSSGMRQKLSIARGLLSYPPVIFMDEPTRSLDPVSALELRAFIQETLIDKLKRTVILVTHRLEEAEALCDRVAIVNRGQIISCGPVAEVKQQIALQQRYQMQVGQLSTGVIETLRDIPGVVELNMLNGVTNRANFELTLTNEQEVLPVVIRYLVTQGGDVQRCQAQSPSLEEAFVHLIRKGHHAG